MQQLRQIAAIVRSAGSANAADYVFAAFVVVAAFAIYAAFGRVFAYSLDLLCILAVMLSVWRGGLYPGLVATFIAAIGGFAIESQGGAPAIEIYVRATLVLALGLFASLGGENNRRIVQAASMSEDTARDREAHIQSILDTVPSAMIVIDEVGCIQRFSAAAERTFGYSRQEAIGQNVRMLMPPPYYAQHDGYIERYLRTGDAKVIGIGREVEGLRKDGSVFPMELSIGEVRIGSQRMFTGFARDLSELRVAESKQRQLQQELAQVWRVRSLGEFATTIAHEINQPLAALANYLRAARSLAIQATAPDAKLIDALSRAGDQAIRAGEIIRRTRTLLRREDTDLRPEKLLTLMNEVDALTQMLAREHNVRIAYAFADPDAEVMADKVQVQQVLLNLLRNAFDALHHAARKEIQVSTESAPDDMTLIRIEDSGPGVSPDIADRLFQPMASTRASGMGLGLSISRTIIEDHGGQLWTESSRLGGASFCLTLRTMSHGGANSLERGDGLHH